MGQPREVRRMIAANREHWDDRAEVHARSRYYDLDLLRTRGPAPIAGPDEAEVGPVAGKALVHLHCHIGTDILRWAALGAQVTGVDFSARSIEIARALAAEVGLDVRFVESDVDDLARTLGGRFDIVYASYGVICWVPDMARWARIAAGLLRPGGTVTRSTWPSIRHGSDVPATSIPGRGNRGVVGPLADSVFVLAVAARPNRRHPH